MKKDNMTSLDIIEHNENPRNKKLFTKAEIETKKMTAVEIIRWNANPKNTELFTREELFIKAKIGEGNPLYCYELAEWNSNPRNKRI